MRRTLFIALLLTTGLITPVLAQQTSVNLGADISKAFDQVEANRKSFDGAAAPARRNLESLTKEAAGLAEQIDKLPAGGSERDQQFQELNGRLLHTQARFISQAAGLIGEASTLLASNMTALNELARKMERSELAGPNATQLRARIERQMDVGRQVLSDLQKMRQMAERDPALRARFASMVNSITAIDRSVSLAKQRLAVAEADAIGTDKSRIVGALDVAVEQLGDMYAALESDKQVLAALREEAEVAVQLATVGLTRQIIERGMPELLKPGSSTSVPGLGQMLDVMQRQNRMILTPSARATPANAGAPGPLDLPKLNNF
jgi:chromosome segregation ATPase